MMISKVLIYNFLKDITLKDMRQSTDDRTCYITIYCERFVFIVVSLILRIDIYIWTNLFTNQRVFVEGMGVSVNHQ